MTQFNSIFRNLFFRFGDKSAIINSARIYSALINSLKVLDKGKSSEKVILVEGEEIINEDRENAEILNTFFSNAVEILEIPEYQETDSLANNTSHPIFKAILKYRNHPSIVAIKNLNNGSRFDFCRVSVQDVVKELKKLC